jgi:hypothetical protein
MRRQEMVRLSDPNNLLKPLIFINKKLSHKIRTPQMYPGFGRMYPDSLGLTGFRSTLHEYRHAGLYPVSTDFWVKRLMA